MTVVLDASVALKWVLSEADSDRALRLLDAFRNKATDLIAPDAFALECAHGLTKAERRGAAVDAEKSWLVLMADSPRLFPSRPLITRAIEIARAARIGVYDCLYVALAEREGCDLITADVRLMNSLGPAFPFVVMLSDLP